MESSDDDKVLPDMESSSSKMKIMRAALSESHIKLQEDTVDGSESDSDSDSDLSDSEYLCSVCSKKFSGYIPFKQHEKSNKHLKALLKKKREKKLLDKITAAKEVTESDEEYLFFTKKPYAVCKPCDKQFGGPESYLTHMRSKTHKQKALQASILEQVTENGEIDVEKLKNFYKSKKTLDGEEDLLEDTEERIASLKVKDDDDDDDDEVEIEEFECKECEKSFSGIIPYTQHIMSKIHAKAVKRKKLLQKIAPEAVQHSAESSVKDLSMLVVEDDILVCKLCSTSFSGPESASMHLKSRGHAKKLEKYRRKKQGKGKVLDAAASTSKADSSSESEQSSRDSSDEEEKVECEKTQTDIADPSDQASKGTLDETEFVNEDSIVKDERSESLSQYERYKNYKEALNAAKDDEKDS